MPGGFSCLIKFFVCFNKHVKIPSTILSAQSKTSVNVSKVSIWICINPTTIYPDILPGTIHS